MSWLFVKTLPTRLDDLLGALSSRHTPSGERLCRKKQNGFMLEHYQLYLDELETIPTLYAYPEKKGLFPPVLYLHSHDGDFSVGKSESIHGAPYLASPSFAEVLTRMRYAVWSTDAWGFEEHGGISESELFKQFLLTGRTLWGTRIYDMISLIDYSEIREDTDIQRLATIGLSMGGLLNWWVTTLDSRVKICINLVAQVDIEILSLHRRLDHRGFYYYVPNLLTAYTTLAIQEEIAPRPRLSLVGRNGTMCLGEGVLRLRKGLDKKYQSVGSPGNFSSFSLTGGHMETQGMRNIWKQFVRKHLRG